VALYEEIDHGGPRRRLRLRSPIDLEPIGEIDCANAQDVGVAVERARKAQIDWAVLSVAQRARFMDRVSREILDRSDEIVDCVIRETGKARNEALAMEIFSSLDALCYYAKNAGRFLRPRKQKLHGLLRLTKQLRIVYRPRGVVGIITPWNGPFILALNPAVQALLAGNAVIVKASEVTPQSTKLVEEMFTAAGLPEGVLQVLLGDGETGAALVNAGVDKISFTGSVETGRKVAEACGRQLIPCTLELGGKDAMIVCEDADIDRAAAGALIGSCMNSGQYCCGTERIYVVEGVYERFVEKVVEGAAALRQGTSGEFDVGAIFWDRQLEVIEAHVADAVAKGARVRVGGRRNPDLAGLYYEPTVLTEVNHEMDVMRDETFGPVISIMKVPSEAEALRLANASPYGLNGNVWTRDRRKALDLAIKMETGGVCVNDMALTYGAPEAPFGGRKQSGVGQVNGEGGVRSYCHALPVLFDRFGGKKLANGYPYRARDAEGLKKLMRLLWGTPLGRWLS
jgi:succinate-semialdehyde dehydrogenase/glutarate-semialdehyde dehydrogenase